MKISFIIPAYNEEKYIGKCLESIIKHGPPDAEIIVINNNSTDQTTGIVNSFPRVKLLFEPTRGTTHTRQKGLENASGELVAFIDADCRLTPEWMNIVAKKFTENKKLVCLSGPYFFYDNTKIKNFLIARPYNYLASLSNKLTNSVIYGGNTIIKKEIINKIGGWDKSINFYGDDVILAKKISTLGKIDFDLKFFVHSSSRRFNHEGIPTMILKYFINFIWVRLFNKPYHQTYLNHR
ncbi:MAG: Glycosyl transferase family 2 [Candidatus Magasanikbacteria bacterium GW2011_GWC2_37_14]|uniref:Glycosyl transferase family 2 n=1 Tax=Candidatus Magasanikbacteria bacterium GW2011_GWC2_37_14 TaxID=1619046 RepID=A0A0G0GDZ1_9BACT|nr:MAG: Glycosyl transferase family 2 [Candidatus Magasanikbacteria bacterium GW2011_GWC2_37_14]